MIDRKIIIGKGKIISATTVLKRINIYLMNVLINFAHFVKQLDIFNLNVPKNNFANIVAQILTQLLTVTVQRSKKD